MPFNIFVGPVKTEDTALAESDVSGETLSIVLSANLTRACSLVMLIILPTTSMVY